MLIIIKEIEYFLALMKTIMNIKFYLKLIVLTLTLTSYCCAMLFDTIARNHDDRRKVYNGDLFSDHKPINTYTNENNDILSDERNVDAHRAASDDEKRGIATAVFGAAWTDLTLNADGRLLPDTMNAERIHKNPYTVDEKGHVVVSNPVLRDHYQIIYWLDSLACDVVSLIVNLPETIIDETLLSIFTDYVGLYAFDGFGKATIAEWLNVVRATHVPGLTDLRVQHLEDQRDLTDWRDYPKFKELTTEICTYVGQPFDGDALETNVLPQGEVLHRWIDSIIRTRNKFCGQPCLGEHGMMNRYTVNYPENLMYNHEHHIATIMMIDAMSKLAIADDDFYDAWAGVTEDTPVSEDFIKRVLNTMEQDAFGETKPGLWRVKAVARTILRKNSALVRLAGDIFSLYAPKMDLKKVYSELMVSGGRYRGWEISGMDTFAHVITLMEEQKAAHPRLETELRIELNQAIPSVISTIYPTSIKGQINNLLIRVKYLLDPCVNHAGKNISIDEYVISFFYLERPINLNLLHSTGKIYRELPDDIVRSLYQDCYQNTQEAEFRFGLQKGIPHIMNKYTNELKKNIKDVRSDYIKIIELYREANSLGDEDAHINLAITLYDYAHALHQGGAESDTDKLNQIKLLREAILLGSKPAELSLAIALNNYSDHFIKEEGGNRKNFPKAIELLRESVDLGYKLAGRNLVTALNAYAVDFIIGNGIAEDFQKAIELLREAIVLGYEPVGGLGFLSPKDNLTIALVNFANKLSKESNPNNANLKKAIELYKEAWALEYEPEMDVIKSNLTVTLNLLAGNYNNGVNGVDKVARNRVKAIILFKEALTLDKKNKDAENNLPIILNALGADYFNGENGVEKDINKAFEYFKEASRLGYKDATNNASKVLFVLDPETYKKANTLNENGINYSYGINGFELDLKKAIGLFRESYSLNFEPARENLMAQLCNQADYFINGTNGFDKNYIEAIKLARESLSLGCKPAQESLAVALYNLAGDYWDGRNGCELDLKKAIELFRESCFLGDEEARIVLPEALSDYGLYCDNKPNPVEQDCVESIELFR